ncbi:nitroreductase family protein [Microbacter margulisiae]|uniref:Nitroreductase n=1 Tax=Microbacter margulisiae TaxID=1350067 RepID=A0A7W5H0Z3_9PORP|nr:nitroreductase family protein [Microbacter margulisiae]MBB3186185.1 nitroreductase [Microbacter margulisiae]
MSDLLYLMEQRRSIRRFENRSVEPEKVEMLLQAGLLAPTSKNSRSWEFIVVDQQDLLQKVSLCREHYSGFVANAPLAIIVAVDPEKNDAWIENGSIASTFIELQAEALGLGSCWVQVTRRPHNERISAEDYLRNILYIPDNMRILNVIAIGYKAQELEPRHVDEVLLSKIHRNGY